MAIEFERTMTEAEFRQPLLDAAEERMAREASGGKDFDVDGLTNSLLGRLLLLFTGRKP